ncbi:methyltransferase domain-containing protein [Brachybacterium sp. EF45031]|uniref:methyltransferase domain-containing protein n=1 Tax=Brachybacterium sillae TaxID=2810536 RepID=UPI00217E21FD|nr:methyltransferase domain-containing protein [Brachybacterium sillae]MCS6711722.1 methyltransferase domain-containing protein [Brachybacterium sillae]
MRCHHFDAGTCRSCSLLALPHEEQVARAQERVQRLLAPYWAEAEARGPDLTDLRWLPPIIGPEAGFRSRGKMAVAGTAAAPVLGLPGQPATADLSDCPLYPEGVEPVLHAARELIRRAQIPPYDVTRRRGEIKNVLVTASPDGHHALRFVLRSEQALPRLREHLPRLLATCPTVQQVSANIHPDHTTAVEGPTEIPLHGPGRLPVPTGDVVLMAHPQAFLQTNPHVAGQLYRQAAAWVASAFAPTPAAPAPRIWDLYCGLGGFALHLARALPHAEITGVEVSAQAIEGAQEAAAALDPAAARPRFLTADATTWAEAQPDADQPDAVVVNPPRRGIGERLATWLEGSSVPHVVYSSCNPATLATDLARMPSLRITAARWVDMFPHTHHSEVVVRLARRPGT